MSKKNNFLFLFVIVSFLFVSSLNAQQVSIKTSADTLQYSAGAYIGQWLKANGIKVTNFDILKKGINDMISGKLSIKDSLLNVRLSRQLSDNQKSSAQEEEQKLFTALRNQKGVGILPSGIAYFVDSAATGGAKPNTNDSVELDIRGAVAGSGQLFVDTYQSKQPLKANLSKLIPGLAEGVQLMSVGSRWRIFIPAALAYGSAGNSSVGIPPYTALIFQVELKKILNK